MFPIFVAQGKSQTRFKVGYIDQTGRVIVDPVFEDGTLFYEGLAAVKIKGGRWGLIDSSGEFVIPPTLWNRCQFQEGLACLATKSGVWGVINRTGNFVVEPKYSLMFPFCEVRAVARIGEWEKSRYGFIGRLGNEIVPTAFHRAWNFSEGLAAVKLAHLWGYIEPSGLFKIAPRFEGTGKAKRSVDIRAGRFVNGFAPVWAGQDFYRFIDTTGALAFEGGFEDANSFSEGRAVVKLGGRYGFIDTMGKLAIDFRFTLARDFSEGLAKIEEKEPRAGVATPVGFIDPDGRMVIPPRFSSAESFRGGLSLVTTDDSIGYIKKSGEYVWQGPFVDYGVLC